MSMPLLVLAMLIAAGLFCRAIVLRAYKKYFSPGTAGDTSLHMVLFRAIHGKKVVKSIEQLLPNSMEMTYPTLFHRVSSIFSVSLVQKHSWVPNVFLFLCSNAFFMLMALYVLRGQNDFSFEHLLVACLAFLFVPSNFIFERGDANYIKFSERFFSRSVSSIGYAASALGMLLHDPVLLFCSVPFWTMSILSAKFSRQVITFELPLLSLALWDASGVAVLIASWALAAAFGRRRLLHSVLQMKKHLAMYRRTFRNSRIIKLQLTSFFELFGKWKAASGRLDRYYLSLYNDPTRFFLNYPELWISLVLPFAHPHPGVSSYGVAAVLGTPVIVYLATSTKHLNFIGEGYRYLDYSLYHLPCLLLALWYPVAPSLVLGLALILMSVSLLISMSNIVRLFQEDAAPRDSLNDFLNTIDLGPEPRIFPISVRTGYDIAARRPEWKLCLWQPGNNEWFSRYIDEYPFIKRDWRPIFEDLRITHVFLDKNAVRYISWSYPLHELRLLREDANYAVFRVPSGETAKGALHDDVAHAVRLSDPTVRRLQMRLGRYAKALEQDQEERIASLEKALFPAAGSRKEALKNAVSMALAIKDMVLAERFASYLEKAPS